MDESLGWALAEFGGADLGDTRRTARLVKMGASVCERPSGKVAAVFGTEREREGAYDFLESEHVAPEEILASVVTASAKRCAGANFVFVPVDGTSITVTDRRRARDFGSIGSDAFDARGLKIVDALAVDPEGTTVGWLGMTFWARSPNRERLRPGTHKSTARPIEEKETRHWVATIKAACAALDEHRIRGWFQIDREGDSRDLLMTLAETSHAWTVRGNVDRSIELEDGTKDRVRSAMSLKSSSHIYELDVAGRPGRARRTARMVVRVGQVVLRLTDRRTDRITRFRANVVWAREEGTTPGKEKPIDWFLLTNQAVETVDGADLVIFGYAQRWRVEECHRTWKSGECDVESTQLHSFAAVQRWSIILGAVATRLERLKRLARKKPDAAATLELTPLEIRALRILKFGVDDGGTSSASLAEAVAWLAELGGYTHKHSGPPPGATVLGRGLRYLRPAARMLALRDGCER